MTERHEQDPDSHPDLEEEMLAAEDLLRECFDCGKMKPEEEFSSDLDTNICKDCKAEQDHQDKVRSDYNASRL